MHRPLEFSGAISRSTPPAKLFRWFACLIHRLRNDQSGNFLMILGLAIIPLTFAVGFGVDYSRAEKLQTELNTVADAAALSAVVPSMLSQSDATAHDAAVATFKAQAATMPGIAGYDDLQVYVVDGTSPVKCNASGSPSSDGGSSVRTVTVCYKAASQNIFSGILGLSTLPVSGTAVAQAAPPPNINFYVMLDNSPSMLLPSTQTGIDAMQQAASCAFACHEQLPRNDGDAPQVNIYSPIYYGTYNHSQLNILLDANYYIIPQCNIANNTPQCTNISSNIAAQCVDGFVSLQCINNNIVQQCSNNGQVSFNNYFLIDMSVANNPTDGTNPSVYCSNGIPMVGYTYCDYGGNVAIYHASSCNGQAPNVQLSNNCQWTDPSTPPTAVAASYWADRYWLTHNWSTIYPGQQNISLRTDEEASAAQALIPFAYNQATTLGVTYQMQMFEFNEPHNQSPQNCYNGASAMSYSANSSVTGLSFSATDPTMTGMTPLTATNYASLAVPALGSGPYQDWWLTDNGAGFSNSADTATQFNDMLACMLTVATPGAGTSAPCVSMPAASTSGTPQQNILFIITDGMTEESNCLPSVCRSPTGVGGPLLDSNSNPNDIALCSLIKAQGFKIAILYTQYLDVGGASDVGNVLPSLNRCSSPGANGSPLVVTVVPGEDITSALQQLFTMATQSVRLIR